MTLHSIFIFLKSGENLISFSSPVVRLDQTLLTGLLTAVREFGYEAIDEEVRTIGAGAYRFHYDVLGDLITVGLADGNADELEVQAVLHTLNVLFFNQFEKALKNWDGSSRQFQAFMPIIHEALRAHNERSQVSKIRISSTEFLLSTLGPMLDSILLNLLIGGAIIMYGGDTTVKHVSEALDQVLPFTVPNMQGISDMETAHGILESRTRQRRKHPTLLGVSEAVYQKLVTPKYVEHYLFLNLTRYPPECSAPKRQPKMNLADQALKISEDTKLQARFLELQLELLRAQLNSFIKFKQNSQGLSPEALQGLLHYDLDRYKLLEFLSRESVLSDSGAALELPEIPQESISPKSQVSSPKTTEKSK
ncbi:MAG: hypothetical protein ACFFDP_03235 [Promethearchaeota archaeon]